MISPKRNSLKNIQLKLNNTPEKENPVFFKHGNYNVKDSTEYNCSKNIYNKLRTEEPQPFCSKFKRLESNVTENLLFKNNISNINRDRYNESVISIEDNTDKTSFDIILQKLNELEKKVNNNNIQPNTNINSKEEEKEDLEALPEDQKNIKRIELVNELIKIGKENPNYNISIPYDNTSLNYLNDIVKSFKKQINKDKGNFWVQICLKIVFHGMEFGLKRVLKIDATGFAQLQIKNIKKYEQIIQELSETYFNSDSGELKLSVEQRAILLILLQTFIFIMMKLGERLPVSKMIIEGVTNFLENNACNYLTNNTGSINNVPEKPTEPGMFDNILSNMFNTPNTSKPPSDAFKTPVVTPGVKKDLNSPMKDVSKSTRRLSPQKRKEQESKE